MSGAAPALNAILLFAAAAAAEIAGCFAVWVVWRQGASAFWLIPGAVSLGLFAWLLAMTPVDAAGRAFAAYGGVYVAASLIWLMAVEGMRPTAWDLGGVALCLAGAAVIMVGGARSV